VHPASNSNVIKAAMATLARRIGVVKIVTFSARGWQRSWSLPLRGTGFAPDVRFFAEVTSRSMYRRRPTEHEPRR
jgi:hypothetical protein